MHNPQSGDWDGNCIGDCNGNRYRNCYCYCNSDRDSYCAGACYCHGDWDSYGNGDGPCNGCKRCTVISGAVTVAVAVAGSVAVAESVAVAVAVAVPVTGSVAVTGTGLPRVQVPTKTKSNSCGEGGIRTLGTVARTHDFQSCTFGRSVTSPGLVHPFVRA